MRGSAVRLAVGGRESSGMSEAPRSGDRGDRVTVVGRAVAQLFVRTAQAKPPQIRHRRRVEVAPERQLQRTRGDVGGRGDIGDGDVVAHM